MRLTDCVHWPYRRYAKSSGPLPNVYLYQQGETDEIWKTFESRFLTSGLHQKQWISKFSWASEGGIVTKQIPGLCLCSFWFNKYWVDQKFIFLTSSQGRMTLLGLITGFENHLWRQALSKNVFMCVPLKWEWGRGENEWLVENWPLTFPNSKKKIVIKY